MKTTKFKVGDKVILTSKEEPSHGWGSARTGDVGVINHIRNGDTFCIDFPKHKDWMGKSSEIKLFTSHKNLAPKKLLNYGVKKTSEGITVGCKKISTNQLKEIKTLMNSFRRKDLGFEIIISHGGDKTEPITLLEIEGLLNL
jgi:hypothetical protein